MNDCQELKNIRYKSLIHNGQPLKETQSLVTQPTSNLQKYLEEEKLVNQNQKWYKLSYMTKMEKINSFVKDRYQELHQLDDTKATQLIEYLSNCILNRRLSKIKDVTYDHVNGNIIDIPGLMFNESNKQYTIRNHHASSHCITKKSKK